MPQDKRASARGPNEAGPPIMQVREEPRWPLATLADPEKEQVIAGVLKEPGRERLSIHQATQRGLLTHGTGLALLEHQAASGYIVDVTKGRLLSVRDAANAGLLDRELFNTLLVAEKAVTGYTDPYTGSKLSLFQAMRKGLLVKEHALRLLEAQAATGGLIHPLHSHRLPPEVAYRWGYLDAETFRLLSDPAGHTKRCFDPNARENLSYRQLLPRCLPDPRTGLLILPVADKGTVHLDEGQRRCLKAAVTRVPGGLFGSCEVSLWDLLFSRYIPRHKRQELLRQYKAEMFTLPDLAQILAAMVAEAEAGNREGEPPAPEREKCKSRRKGTEKALKARATTVSAGEFHGRKVSVWDLLHSKYVPKRKRKELLQLYKSGVLTEDQMETVVTAIVAKIEEEKAEAVMAAVAASTSQEAGGSILPGEDQLRRSLRLLQVPVAFGELVEESVPALDLLYSKHFPQEKREELVELYRTGVLSRGQMVDAIRTTLEREAGHRKSFLRRIRNRSQAASRPREPPFEASPPPGHPSDELLKANIITLPAGELQGQQMSLWDLLFSQYLTREKAEELLQKHRDGKFSASELASMLTILVALHNLFHSLEQTPTGRSEGHPLAHEAPGPLPNPSVEKEDDDDDDDDDDEEDDDDKKEEEEEDKKKDAILKARMVDVAVGDFRGRKVSVWDLLYSRYFPEKKRKEILKLYRIGILTADQVETVATAVVTRVSEEEAKAGRSPSAGRPEGGEVPEGSRSGSVWELFFSPEVPEAKRRDLLARYVTGALSGPETASILGALVLESRKQRSCPCLPYLLAPWHLEGPPGLTSGPRGASVHDILLAAEQEAHNANATAGRVTLSEITVTTTTVVQGPEQKAG